MNIQTAKQNMALRQWTNINKSRAHMEEMILKLMANPETDPEYLAQAHAMYSDVCARLSAISHHVDNVIRTGSTTGLEIYEHTCVCGHTSKQIKGHTFRCPDCGML
jgi:hypothetical protein